MNKNFPVIVRNKLSNLPRNEPHVTHAHQLLRKFQTSKSVFLISSKFIVEVAPGVCTGFVLDQFGALIGSVR